VLTAFAAPVEVGSSTTTQRGVRRKSWWTLSYFEECALPAIGPTSLIATSSLRHGLVRDAKGQAVDSNSNPHDSFFSFSPFSFNSPIKIEYSGDSDTLI
jgi:hypothetical protein